VAPRRHGHAIRGAVSPTYVCYKSMHWRCSQSNKQDCQYYSDRGVIVCERWMGPDGFDRFLDDMGLKPPGKQIDRYPDPDGNYEPDNCRWATPAETPRASNSATSSMRYLCAAPPVSNWCLNGKTPSRRRRRRVNRLGAGARRVGGRRPPGHDPLRNRLALAPKR
jgi:hypothetical protein